MSNPQPAKRDFAAEKRLNPPSVDVKAMFGLSETVVEKTMDFLIHLVDTGKTSLIGSYTGSIESADILHSAGLLSDTAYNAIFRLDTIMAAIGSVSGGIGTIFGAASPFAPSLKTLIELKAEKEKKAPSVSKAQKVIEDIESEEP